MVLYPDGPCQEIGSASVVINVTFLPCPHGFTQYNEVCICEERLHQYQINCTVAETPYMTKTSSSQFWVGVLYTNTTYRGLISSNSCPADNCRAGTVNITLHNTDVQCDLNRAGLLCGTCAVNYSLLFVKS